MARTGVSSLLRAARAAQARQASLEDSIAAYEYDLSPKDQAAYDKYAGYLNRRLSLTQNTDPAKALNYQKTLTTANRSFTSSELSRATTQVMYGAIDDRSKLNTMLNLYQRALANGDENLAQRIESQAATLQNKILNTGRAGGGGGGGGDTATKKGINNQVSEIDRELKRLELDFSRNQMTDSAYIAKKTALYDAKNNVLSNAYSINQSTNELIPVRGMSISDAEDFYNKHNALQNNNDFQRLMANSANMPLDLAAARSQSFLRPQFNPATNQIDLQPKDIIGLRRATEFGSTTPFAISGMNIKNDEIKKEFAKAGYGKFASQVQGGKLKMDYIDPYTGEQRSADFYLGEQDGKKYAYTFGPDNVKYLLTSKGEVSPMISSARANKQVGELKDKLARGEITQQQYNEQIQNVETDYANPNLLNELSQQGQADADAQYLGLAGFGRKLGEAISPLASGFSRNIGSLFQKKQQSDLNTQLGKLAGELGTGNVLGALGTFASNPLGFLGNLGGVQSKIKEYEQKVQAKRAIDAENARREAERLQAENRRVVEESNRIIQQQRAAEAANRARSVVFKTPVIDYTKIADPDVRARTAIQEGLRNPFTGKGPFGF